MRANTCAGPISAPADTACRVVAPAASRIRGRCAAIAPVTLQAAAKANAKRIMVRSIGMCGLTAAATVAFAPFTAGSMKKFSGRPTRICAAAQAKQAPGKPVFATPEAVPPADVCPPESPPRPANGACETRHQRDPRDWPARGVAVDAPERSEGG